MLTHGESDAGSATFEADMVQAVAELQPGPAAAHRPDDQHPDAAVAAALGADDRRAARSTATLAQWRIGVDRPGDIICTGPKYQYAYVNDNIHLTNPDYERLGEKYGQVFHQRVVLGNPWQPLQPTSVERSGRVITVHFHVPVPPLAWDTTLAMPHQSAYTEWAQGRGFEVRAGTTRIADQRRRDRGRHACRSPARPTCPRPASWSATHSPPTARCARTAPSAGASCAIPIRSSAR